TEAERRLCELTRDLLEIPHVSVTDNFFYLGGDSNSAIRVDHRAIANGLLIDARDVFVHPVLEDLALRAGRATVHRPPPDAVPLFNNATLSHLRSQFPDFEDAWPLTPLQAGLWFHAQCETTGNDPYL